MIHDIFYMLLLEQETTKKRQVDKNVIELDIANHNNRKYKVEVIYNSAIYMKESIGSLPGL